MNFERKSHGAIFTDKEENIELIKEVVREMDFFEYGYLPDGIIKVFNPRKTTYGETEMVSVDLAYTSKFDALDLNELVIRCWNKGIIAWYMFGTTEEDTLHIHIAKGETHDAE